MPRQVSHVARLPKSKEEHAMPLRESPLIDSTGAGRIADGWRKIVTRRVHEVVGPDPDLDADVVEQVAAAAACAVAKGTIEELLEKEAALLGAEQPCPSCKRARPLSLGCCGMQRNHFVWRVCERRGRPRHVTGREPEYIKIKGFVE
jgi:hypothetical protein